MEDSTTKYDSLAARLEARAGLLSKVRRFFDSRAFVEVQTPLASREVIPELHIEPFEIVARHPNPDERFWLQASPEAGMKQLLVALAREQQTTTPLAIYQVTRSFRAGEWGPMHRPEFTIVEWYRTGDDMTAGIDLLSDLCRDAVSAPSAKRTSYHEALAQFAGVNPHTATSRQLQTAIERHNIRFDFPGPPERDDLLNVLLVKLVEPNLGRDAPEILYDYPASQASLARIRTCADGTRVAERFELYWRGVELANGFHELADATELRRRFVEVNFAREADGRPSLPLPERFLSAIERGLPPCTGVALGFDRLLMVSMGEAAFDERLPSHEDST